MARKNRNYEFRPDKTGSGLLNKLYITQKQRLALAKWLCYSLVLLVLEVIQSVALSRISLFGATTDLVPCAIMLICVLEGAEAGCVFSLAAAAFFALSGSAPGYFVLAVIPVLACFGAVFRQSYLQKGFSSTVLCAGLAVMLYELAVFVVGVLFEFTYAGRIGVFALRGLYSLICIPALHPLCQAIGKIGGETWKD